MSLADAAENSNDFRENNWCFVVAELIPLFRIFPIFLIESLEKELLPRTRKPLLRVISSYFYHQSELLDLFDELTSPHKRYSSV